MISLIGVKVNYPSQGHGNVRFSDRQFVTGIKENVWTSEIYLATCISHEYWG